MRRKMSPYEVYKLYLGLRLHFVNESYDFVKYNGGVKANVRSFEKRKDKHFFNRLSWSMKDEDIRKLLIANFAIGDSYGGIDNIKNAEEVYSEWKKRIQSLSYVFKTDINTLLGKVEDFDKWFEVVDDNAIVLIALYQEDISLETFVILDKILNFVQAIDRQLDDDLIWPEWRMRVIKYGKFLNIDTEKFKGILKKELAIL